VVPILCDGTLEPPPGSQLRARSAATVAELLVAEGQPVKKGVVLLRLQNQELSTKALESRSSVLEAEAERTRAAADLEQTTLEHKRRQSVFEADGRLLRQGAISQAEYDADELSLRQASERVRVSEARLRSLSRPGGQSGAAPSRIELLEASARGLERQVEALTMRAPTDGIVYGLPREVGEAVSAGQVIASIADRERRTVRARVDQPDLPRVQAGQRMVVTFDGLPSRRWEGRVRLVSPGLREAGGRWVGEAFGEIADPTAALSPNALVSVQIVAAEKPGALLIPRGALYRSDEERFVWVLRSGRARSQKVSIGLLAPNEVEVMAGLSVGDRVIVSSGAVLFDGLGVVAAGN